jgi:outer membrane protein OmpA-like peptidoglycan-associated protein
MTTRLFSVFFFVFCALSQKTQAQSVAIDTIEWRFEQGKLAIDANRLTETLASQGYDQAFFSQPDIHLKIIGSADCPEFEARNEDLAKGRCAYLSNYFESGRFGTLQVASRDFVVEKNCGAGKENPEVRKVTLVIGRIKKDEAVVVQPEPAKEKPSSLDRISDLEVGQTLVLDGLNFYPGSHRTLPEAKPVLKKLLEIMNTNPSLKIEIQGHVCCGKKPDEDGEDEETGKYNLSWTRAQFVYDHLLKNGIDPSRITYKGYAMMRPLVTPEVTIGDQIKNRRVEVMVTGK